MRILFILFVALLPLFSHGSSPWIEGSMHYFKIKVGADGLYKISQAQIDQSLNAAGFTFSSVDSSKWALFFRGKEMAIHYDMGDIYFYGQRNDAALDTGLYFEGGLLNPYLNIHSDTTAYFLSWYQDSRIGKRITQTSASNPVSVPYHFARKDWVPKYRYFSGENFSTSASGLLYMATFQPGEGWTGPRSTTSIQIDLDSLSQSYFSGPNPLLELILCKENTGGNSANILVGSNSPRVWKSSVGGNAVGPLVLRDQIVPSDIVQNSLRVQTNITNGFFSAVHAKLLYPQTIGMHGSNSKIFILDSINGSENSFSISDLNIASADDIFAFDISDVYNIRSCAIQYSPGTGDITISLNGANLLRRKILVIKKNSIFSAAQPYHRPFQDLSNPDEDFLIVYPNIFDSAATEYSNYRSTVQGGSYKVLKINTEEVYDQFSFGEFTPIGIHEFARFMHNNSSASSNYLFLMGKGIFVNTPKKIGPITYIWRFNPEVFTYDILIPTFGYPGGDWPYTMNIDPANKYHISFGVGRITSRTQNQALAYLNKVKEFEDPANNGLWKKRMLHLSGGNTENEIQSFYSTINQFKSIAEAPFLGARVESISKTDPSGIQNIHVDTSINRGISLLTMYGHTSVFFNDIQIGDVNDPNLNYNNSDGQFPMFIINGCESGRIYEEFESWAQNWVNEPEKGASLMLAHSFFGFDPILKFYTEQFYKTAFADSLYFGKPIGDILSASSRKFYDDYSSGYLRFAQSQVQLMTLQGDPALRISAGLGKPDYATRGSDIEAVNFVSEPITTITDSFQLKIPIENYGLFADHKLGILVERLSPIYRSFDTVYIPSFGYSDTVYITIYNSPDNLLLGGLNEFRVSIDPENTIDESNKANNVAFFSINVPNQFVRNISPINFGIASSNSVRLVSSGQLIGQQTLINYQFELDTTFDFSSPFKKSFQTEDGVISFWDVELIDPSGLQDSLVYFWRSKRQEDTIWSQSSFTVIPNSEAGWTQRIYGQYLENDFFGGLDLDSSNRNFKFDDFSSVLNIRGAGHFGQYRDTTFIQIGNALLKINSDLEARKCPLRSLLFVKISGRTGQPYRDLYTPDGRNCGILPFGVRAFNLAALNNDTFPESILNYVNSVRKDDYILLLRHGNVRFDLVSKAFKDTMAVFGIDTLLWTDISNNAPMLFLGKRNWNGSILMRGDTSISTSLDSQIVVLNYNLTEFYRDGEMISDRIGPAKSWKQMVYNLTKEPNDDSEITIYGIRKNGKSEIVKNNISPGLTDLGDINAESFPWLQVSAYFQDTIDRSSPQLQNWTVIYQGHAEGIIDPLAFGPDTYKSLSFQEGDTIKIPYSFKNVSEFDFSDSLKVRFSIDEKIYWEIVINGPDAGDSTIFEFKYSSLGLSGDYVLRTFVNPFEVPELYYDNNILESDLNIYPDLTPPLISVLFDNKRIINGDIVAFNTKIKMQLVDENPFFNTIDSGSLFFSINKVDNFFDSLINIPSSQISWSPETDISAFSVDILPDSLYDGRYRLDFNGRDASGNLAGPFPKSIEFEIQSGIPSNYQDLAIFPNPFQSSLLLEFTLLGGEIPRKFILMVHDLRGRQLYSKDLRNEIKLGNNTLEIWDGKNSEGHIVPSGIYIYRLEIDGIQPFKESGPLVGKVIFKP